MIAEINAYMEKYSFISVTGLCDSILGRTVPVISLGEGKTVIAYVGGEQGNDVQSPSVLLRFVKDICALYEEGGAAFGFSAEHILQSFTIVVIPMLNPDGVSYCVTGVDADNPLRDRLIKINGGSLDFSNWRGNARGVELKYNYGAERSEYEPEAEVGALCNFFRFGMTPSMLFAFSQSDEAEGRICFGEGERESKTAIALTQMTGYKRCFRQSEEPVLMLTDWSIKELSSAAFSIELAPIENMGIKRTQDKIFSVYAQMRKMLFCAPFLNKIK